MFKVIALYRSISKQVTFIWKKAHFWFSGCIVGLFLWANVSVHWQDFTFVAPDQCPDFSTREL